MPIRQEDLGWGGAQPSDHRRQLQFRFVCGACSAHTGFVRQSPSTPPTVIPSQEIARWPVHTIPGGGLRPQKVCVPEIGLHFPARFINHLAKVVGSKPGSPAYRAKRHTSPFWAYPHTLPQGVELFVLPLIESLFCSINTPPNEFLVRKPPPQTAPPFETQFFEGGIKNVEKMTPPFCWVKNHESFGFFQF